MQDLFTPEGEAALAAVVRLRPLLAFDFDGTLAPIVAQPADARIAAPLARRLATLAARLPVAIVTGRAIVDVRSRLGFEPRFVVGDRGAEDARDADGAARRRAALDTLRGALRARQPALAAAGIVIEDKGQSLALHYRRARHRAQARDLTLELLSPHGADLQVFGGKMVVNVMPAGAPDKASAVHDLVRRCAVPAALFAGDDVNDEPVFRAAPAHWLTLRVGRGGPPSAARFGLDGPRDMLRLVERIETLHDRLEAG